MNKKLIFGLIPVVVITLLIPGALSSCGYLSSFEKTYPDAVGSRIDTCELCHINPSGGGPLNSYGTDFANNRHNFTAIESNDSDKDRFTNIAEINATTFPGNALDNPLTPKQTPALDGATLYSSYCQDCHNPLTSSSKLGATAAQIQIAINTVPEMKTLSPLRMAQLQAISTALAVSPTSSPTTALDRAALYASYCQGCHNPLASSTKHGRTADQIKNSISTVSAMKSLSSLNSAQLQAIAIALGASQTPIPSVILDGASLYAGNCAGCHSSLASTVKPGRTAAQIQNAISAVSSMNSLSSLSSAQIQAIAAALPPAPAPTPPLALTTTLDGATLYASFCTSCHSSLASTSKPGRTAAQITSAISSVPDMSSLSSLSAEQIAAIAAILPAIPTPTPSPTPTLNGTALYAGNCAGCHNPLASTTKPGRTATQITNAISTVSTMSSLSSLTSLSSAQITAIAAILPPIPTPTPSPTPTLNGSALYAGNCAGCHGLLASTTKPGRTATQITNAIGSVSAMSSLSSLTSLSSVQLQAIAAALPSTPSPTTTTTPPPTTTQNGTALYSSYCSNCHSPLASTSKPGRTATQITNAISTVSAMSSLSSLTSLSSVQLQAIAAALPSTPSPTTTTTPPPTTTQNGTALYSSYCSNCHSPLASTSKPGRTATQITNAISTVSAMSSLSSLTSTQLQAIATALSSTPSPTTTSTPPPTLDGATLYSSNCAGCHNPLASTLKPGRTATQITNAIGSVSAMSSLSSLTSLSSAQIQAIAAALPPIPTDGASLYASYCSSCHHLLASSDVKKKSVSDITSAISSVSKMKSISLTSTQIAAIAKALSTA
jgi:mono/diheme cytochrome c family protein